MKILFYNPPDDYKDQVKEVWIWNEVRSENLPWILPSYEMELVFHLGFPPVILNGAGKKIQLPKFHWVGPQTSRWKILDNQILNLVSIRFYPSSCFQLFGMPGIKLRNQYAEFYLDDKLDISFLLDLSNEKNVIAGLIQVIQNIEKGGNDIPAYLRFAIVELTKKQISIGKLSSRLFISRKQLDRKFKEVIGMSPSEFRKINRILDMVRNPDNYKINNPALKLTDIAYKKEFSDQSHFNHEFKEISGSVPGLWFSEYEKMSHFYKSNAVNSSYSKGRGK
ncbi:AraC family transcriptional regulator [Leptospira sp. 96542]|nr:AraC family transcriptional regulator [Leptospira sp. 96542]